MEKNDISKTVKSYCYAVDPKIGFSAHILQAGEYYDPDDVSLNRLIYVEKGSLTVDVIGRETFAVGEGEFTFIPLSLPFKVTSDQETQFMVLSTIRVEMICHRVTMPHPKLDKLETLTYAPNKHAYAAPEIVKNIFTTVLSYMDAKLGCSELYHLKECELFLVLRFILSPDDFKAVFHPMFEERVDFKSRVITMADKHTSVIEIAKLMGMERIHFYHVFRSEFGCSPQEWLQKHKAERALKYIRRKDMPLKLVASELNFSSQTHLNEFCKKYFGKTARRLRLDEI